MPCFSPITGFRSVKRSPTSGKRIITFKPPQDFFEKLQLPCGRCIGCKLEKSRQWAVRLQHEASLHDKNCFVTLTYDDKHLPPYGSLQLRDFQLFMKRVRKKFGPKIRFYHCGEYGKKFQRPHYHVLLFGFDFRDKVYWRTIRGNKYYRSPSLEKLWDKGFSSIGDVTFDSAAYVARYVTKKKVAGKPSTNTYSSTLSPARYLRISSLSTRRCLVGPASRKSGSKNGRPTSSRKTKSSSKAKR